MISQMTVPMMELMMMVQRHVMLVMVMLMKMLQIERPGIISESCKEGGGQRMPGGCREWSGNGARECAGRERGPISCLQDRRVLGLPRRDTILPT